LHFGQGLSCLFGGSPSLSGPWDRKG
jgi:hypothetical protein